jgi:hypothetical protein
LVGGSIPSLPTILQWFGRFEKAFDRRDPPAIDIGVLRRRITI